MLLLGLLGGFNPTLNEGEGFADKHIAVRANVVKHAALKCKVAETGIVSLETDIAFKTDLGQCGKDLSPGDQSAARNPAVVLARVDPPKPFAHGPDGVPVIANFGDQVIRIEQHAQIGMSGELDESHDLLRCVGDVRAKVAHRLEDDVDPLTRSILGKRVQPFGGPGVFRVWRASPFDDAGMSIKRSGVCLGAKLVGQVNLFLVPGQAACALLPLIGREVTVEWP